MSPSPIPGLARIILTSSALVGGLLLVALELLILGAGSAELATASLRCLIAPVSSLDAAVHASAVAAGILASLPILTAIRAASRTRAGVAEIDHAAKAARLSPPPPVVAAARAASIDGRIDLVNASRPFAFAYGWIRPRVCVSTGLVGLLNDRELEAVFHHESWHVFRRDPLRLLVAQTIGAAFGVVPEIRRLVRAYLLAVEVAADHHVVTAMGHPRWLASALGKTLGPPVARPAFEGEVEARIAALAGQPPAMPRGRGWLAAAALIVELVVLVPLLTNGSLVSLAGVWLHPVC